MSASANIRFPTLVDEGLSDYARQAHMPKSTVAREHEAQDRALAAWEKRQALKCA